MKQPPGFEIEGKKDLVCLLQRSLYGLKQSPKSWNDEINAALLKMNFIRNRANPCLYYTKFEDGDECMLLIYVDDILIMTKNNNKIEEMKTKINNLFDIRDLGEIENFLGIQIKKNDGIYNLNQHKYINKLLADYSMKDATISKIPISPSYGKTAEQVLLPNNTQYQQLIGSLLYIAINTRPDISAAICILAQKVSEPTTEDWNELKRVLKYLKGTDDLKLFVANNTQKKLHGFVEANYGEDRVDRKSKADIFLCITVEL